MNLTESRNFAKNATVHIKGENSTIVFGSGLVFKKEESYYLLTAAHVLVYLKQEFTLKFDSEDSSKKVQMTNSYISELYIKHGYQDVGVAQFKFENVPEEDLSGRKINLLRGRCPDKIVGCGLDGLLKPGYIVESDEQMRARVFQSYSKPGCSGSPIFDESCGLFGLVHGPSKHRGTNHFASNDSVAIEYFADWVGNRLELKEIKNTPDVMRLLKLAEEAPEELQANPTNTISDYSGRKDIQEYFIELGGALGETPDNLSIQKAFEKIASKAFSEENSSFKFSINLEVIIYNKREG
jgi:hypothetical protein